MFFPRGGSAHVVRALGGELEALGHDVTLVTGSLPGGHGDARAFYAGLDVRVVEFGAVDGPPMLTFQPGRYRPRGVLARAARRRAARLAARRGGG